MILKQLGKNKKKLIMLLIIAFLSANSFAQTLPAEEASYSLETIIGMAINNSPALKSAEYSSESTFKKMEESGKLTSFVPAAGFVVNDPTTLNVYKMARSYDIAYDLSKKNLVLQKDKLRHQVIQNYFEIFNLEAEQESLSLALELSKKNMDLMVLRNNYGLLSDLEKTSAQKAYEVAKKNKALIDAELVKAYSNLNALIGMSDSKEIKLQYEDMTDISAPLKPEDLQIFSKKAAADNLIIEMAQENLELKKLEVDYYIFNYTPGSTYDSAEDEYRSHQYSFDVTKDGIEKFIREIFYSAQKVQENYQQLLLKDSIERDLYKVKEIQFANGMITNLELKEAQDALLENQANLQALKSAYNELIYVLNNPHVQLA